MFDPCEDEGAKVPVLAIIATAKTRCVSQSDRLGYRMVLPLWRSCGGQRGEGLFTRPPGWHATGSIQFRRNPRHEIMDDLSVFLVLELVGKFQPQLADIRQDSVGKQLL